MDAQEHITLMLDSLAELHAQRDLIMAERARAEDGVLTVEIRD